MDTDDCDAVRRLFVQEVPEIASGAVEIMAMARIPGVRTKLAVRSVDKKVDCVAACVGVRGCRIKNVLDQLGERGERERFEILRWSESIERLIENSLQPAIVARVILDVPRHRARVIMPEKQAYVTGFPLEENHLLGRLEESRFLASRLCGWEIEIVFGEKETS